MAETAFKGNPVNTVGDLPAPGAAAPELNLTGTDLGDITLAGLAGRRVVLNIFPSVDTGVCAASVRKFNELAAGLHNTTVVCASADLPFALGRFCGAEGIENVVSGSSFRSDFGDDYGVTMTDGPLRGLLARSVVVVDTDGKVLHTELVPEITTEPDYDAAVAALG
ncbi:thiol peroxidase [Nostocoides australiense]|uniref:Thiol peroxidase n=1 Tax=Nostocoides australiense Ben110 TaxID=1193182 RepID=W6JZU2_9MICO|nr:thiol peroxidase [Tetrasphaera australiensis]MCA0291537.1 thiol peroxidase [Actinomycetota bacterium]CCH71599.1 lipid hydroperoxide peroxidase [Tetrasphaera australiensis Ben110]HPF80125.1 thiol peroxidase [Tetrasphaera australiensis]HRW01230.1 thiol peroxidase [Tetrasphaera sp.]